jgi:SAM-dependent methyltransferase
MDYDPIKRQTGYIFNCCRAARILFYKLLDILLLRSWYVRRDVRKWAETAPDNATILDAGSGFGQYVYFMSRLRGNFSIKGVDVKADELEICERFFGSGRSGGRVRFEKADLNNFSEPLAYNLALCVDVLEHIKDDTGVMENLCKSLKPGGILIISTPSDKGGSDVHDAGETSFIGEHVRDGYGRGEITEKLLSAGFSRVDSRYSYGKYGQLSWRLSMKYPIKMLNMGKLFFLVLPFYYLVAFPFALVLNYIDINSKNESGTGLIVKAVK